MGKRGKNAKESFTVEWLLFHTVNLSTENQAHLSLLGILCMNIAGKHNFDVIRRFTVVLHQTYQETANRLQQRLHKTGFPRGIFYCYFEEKKMMKNWKEL